MNAKPLRVVACLVCGLALPAVGRSAEAMAVVPEAEGAGPGMALVDLAGEVRGALAALGAGVLEAEALRERATGSPAPAVLAESDADYRAALDTHSRGDFEGAIRGLRALVTELELLQSCPEVAVRWERAMLRLARSEQALGRPGEARAVLERLLRAAPALEVDGRLYPPGFQRLVEEVRGELRALPTRTLVVQAGSGVRIWLEGRMVGAGSVQLQLPPGRYRVSGTSQGIRSRDVTVDLTSEDRRLELDLSAADGLRVDQGPGIAVGSRDRLQRRVGVGRLLDLDRLVTVRLATEGDRTWVVAAAVDVRLGASGDEGRVALVDGQLPGGGAAALARFLLAGERSPLVEVVPAPHLDARLALGPERPRGWLAWDGVKRPGTRPVGWSALGLGAASVVLGVVAIDRVGAANKAYLRADGMLAPGGQSLKAGYSPAEYNAQVRRGDRAREDARAAGIAAGATAVVGIVLGVVSYHRTGEIGPIRF